MEIGIFSGSFDPIHTGHAIVANYLAQYCGLDEVWLKPSPLNPLKQDTRPPADSRHRLEMCRIIADKCRGVRVSDFEMSLPLPSYSWRTLTMLRDAMPELRFHSPPGPGVTGTLPEGVTLLRDAPQAVMSSTFIRSAIAEGKNLSFFLDDAVAGYIKTHGLYE